MFDQQLHVTPQLPTHLQVIVVGGVGGRFRISLVALRRVHTSPLLTDVGGRGGGPGGLPLRAGARGVAARCPGGPRRAGVAGAARSRTFRARADAVGLGANRAAKRFSRSLRRAKRSLSFCSFAAFLFSV